MDSPTLSSAGLSETSEYELVDADTWSIASSDDEHDADPDSGSVSDVLSDQEAALPDLPLDVVSGNSTISEHFSIHDSLADSLNPFGLQSEARTVDDAQVTKAEDPIEVSTDSLQESVQTPLEFNLSFPDPWHSASESLQSSTQDAFHDLETAPSVASDSSGICDLLLATLSEHADDDSVASLNTDNSRPIETRTCIVHDENAERSADMPVASYSDAESIELPDKEASLSFVEPSPSLVAGAAKGMTLPRVRRNYRLLGLVVLAAACSLPLALERIQGRTVSELATATNQTANSSGLPRGATQQTRVPTQDTSFIAQLPLQLDGGPLPLLLDGAPESFGEPSNEDAITAIDASSQSQAMSRYIPHPPALCPGAEEYSESLQSTLESFIDRVTWEAPATRTKRAKRAVSSRHRRAKRNAKRLLKRGRKVAQQVGEAWL